MVRGRNKNETNYNNCMISMRTLELEVECPLEGEVDEQVMENEVENEDYDQMVKENIDRGCPMSFADNFLVDVGHDDSKELGELWHVPNDDCIEWKNLHKMKKRIWSNLYKS